MKKEKLDAVSTELKSVMLQIPYLQEVIVGGELAKLAFEYLKENAPEHVKEDARGAWNVAVQGRFTAFKNWVKEVWTGNSRLMTAIGDYEDFLAMFPDGDTTIQPSFRTFYECTRAPADLGDFATFQVIMNRMGHVADKRHYVEIRQEGRQTKSGGFFSTADVSLQEQITYTYKRIVELE